MPPLTPQSAFSKFVPDSAVDYCITLYTENKFDLKITKSRATKLGDYKYDFYKKKHTISVNHDLNPFGFLITYLHEVAHLKTFNKYGSKVLPHGGEWKREFQHLVVPVLDKYTFPDKIFDALSKYMNNPKASSCSDAHLIEAIRSFNTDQSHRSLVELNHGDKFIFNKRLFTKEELKRTRYICKDERTGKRYLISKVASVTKVEEELGL